MSSACQHGLPATLNGRCGPAACLGKHLEPAGPQQACAPALPACRGGYAAFIWHAASATLSLDLFAASDGAGARAAHAAQQLCEQLLARWPGSHIEASSVARLPRHEAEQQQSAGLGPPSS